MSKLLFFFLFASFVATLDLQSARSSEISAVSGTPDLSLDFVQALLDQQLQLLPPDTLPEQELSTVAFSIFSENQVQSASVISVLQFTGLASVHHWMEGLQWGAARSPIVYSNLGPLLSPICEQIRKFPQTVFVFTAGNGGKNLSTDPGLNDCAAPNALIVAALNQTQQQLTEYSNWGSIVRIAAPSVDISAVGRGGIRKSYSNSTVGAALVAARISEFSKSISPKLQGEDLVQAFLDRETLQLPRLLQKIPRGLALKP